MFYDLVVEVALIRPGPIQGGSVHPYIRRRNGVDPVTYDHPSMEQALRKTLGVPLFQEQLMQLAVDCAGFTAAEADQLRRAMGSKRSTERMRRLRGRFYDGMRELHGITGEVADRIYEKLEAFANFGFPESHSLSFASLVFYSSWFKLHHPAAFCAALLRAQPMGFYSPQSLVADARRHGVTVHGPDVNASLAHATLENDGTEVRLGLGSVRHIGDELAERMVDERKVNGPFASLLDLTGAGAALGAADRGAGHRWRAGLLRDHPPRGAVGGGRGRDPATGPAARCRIVVAHPVAARDDRAGVGRGRCVGHRRLAGQLSHPVPARATSTHSASSRPTGCCRSPTAPGCWSPGAVTHRQRPGTARGVTFMNLEDETGMVNVLCTPGVWARHRRLAQTASAMLIRGQLQNASGAVTVVAERMGSSTCGWARAHATSVSEANWNIGLSQ